MVYAAAAGWVFLQCFPQTIELPDNFVFFRLLVNVPYPNGQNDYPGKQIGIVGDEPPENGQRGNPGFVGDKVAQKIGEDVFGNTAAAGGRAYQQNNPHAQLPAVNKKLVVQVFRLFEKGHKQKIDHPVASGPRQDGGQATFYPVNRRFFLDNFRGVYQLVSPFAGAHTPFFYQGEKKNPRNERLEKIRIDKQGVGQKKRVHEDNAEPEIKAVNDFGIVLGFGRENVVAVKQVNQRYRNNEKYFIQKNGGEYHGCTFSAAESFLVQKKDGRRRAAHHRRRYGRTKLPQHDVVESLSPGEAVVG